MILSIQYLRGLAALFVVLYHIAFKDQQYSAGMFSFEIGMIGVDIFFVISGFIMYYVSINKPNTLVTVATFLKHRVIRIIPLYWLITTVALIVYLVTPENVNRYTGSTDILSSYTLFPSYTMYLLPIGWTLSYEFYFYFLFSIALLFSRYRALIIILLLFSLVSVGLIYGFDQSMVLPDFLTNNFLLEFLYGIIIAKIFLRVREKKILISAIALSLFVLLMTIYFLGYQSGIRGLDLGLPAMMIVLTLVMLEENIKIREVIFLKKLGDISFSLYLVHLLALGFVALVYRKLNVQSISGEILYLIAMLVLSIVAGYFTYYLIEKKLTHFFRGKLH